MFNLNPKIASTLPSVAKPYKPYKWEVFEITAKDGCKYIVSIGSYESNVGVGGPRMIDVLVANNHSGQKSPRPAMVGGGSKQNASVKVTPGGVYLDVSHLKFLGIGSLVFNIVVEWAKHNYPGLAVIPIRIMQQDPQSETSKQFKKRRDALIKFYGRFGFKWQTPPIKDEGGGFSSDGMTENDLKLYSETNLRHVRRLDLPGMLDVLLEDSKRLIENKNELKVQSNRLVNTRALLKSRRDPWNVVGKSLNFIMLPLLFVIGIIVGRWIG